MAALLLSWILGILIADALAVGGNFSKFLFHLVKGLPKNAGWMLEGSLIKIGKMI